MKTSIKATIGIIALTIGSASIVHAEDFRKHRNFDGPRHERQMDRYDRRAEARREFRHDRRQARRDFRQSRREFYQARRDYREARRDFHQAQRAKRYMRMHRHYRNQRGWKHGWRHHQNHYYRDRHVSYAPVYTPAPAVVVSSGHRGNPLPALAGGIIGSSIANNASNGDPAATIGGMVFGAIVGDALANH